MSRPYAARSFRYCGMDSVKISTYTLWVEIEIKMWGWFIFSFYVSPISPIISLVYIEWILY